MTRRAFLEHHTSAWAERADARRRSGAARDLMIAGALDRVVAAMLAELASLPPEIASPTAELASVNDETPITWRSPVFNAGGRFNPFAGTYAEGMLASAATCEALGYPELAARYRQRAAAAAPDVAAAEACAAFPRPQPARRRPEVWTGPNITPPEPVPFVAGPQMGLFA